MKKNNNITFKIFRLIPILLLLEGRYADAQITQPDGYVSVYNACTQPVWVWSTWTSDNENIPGRTKRRKYHRLDKIAPNTQFNFGGAQAGSAQWPINGTLETFNPNLNSWNGLAALRIVPKIGCDNFGSNCNVGESILTVPDTTDALYDHLYYAPEGLYSNLPIDGESIVEYLKNLGPNPSPETKTAAAYAIKKAIYTTETVFPQPSVESSFEATFKCKDKNKKGREDEYCQTTASQLPLEGGNYYDISFVDGFTIPVFVKVFQNPDALPFEDMENSASCTDIDGSNHLPVSEASQKFVPADISSRGHRPIFSEICTMNGVFLKANFFADQPEYNFENLNPAVINPKTGEIVGCASPKARLLMHGDDYTWLKPGEFLLDDLYDEKDTGAQEYDSRVIQFSCPYAQSNLAYFQPTSCGNFQCNLPCTDNPTSLCVKTYAQPPQQEAYLSPFDLKANRYGKKLPFTQLIEKNLGNSAFRASSMAGQGANNLCHGPGLENGTYANSDYPIENTSWVRNLRATTTNIYTYTFDDAAGLRRCNSSKSSFVYVLCGDETFINNQL